MITETKNAPTTNKRESVVYIRNQCGKLVTPSYFWTFYLIRTNGFGHGSQWLLLTDFLLYVVFDVPALSENATSKITKQKGYELLTVKTSTYLWFLNFFCIES